VRCCVLSFIGALGKPVTNNLSMKQSQKLPDP
jgi:hypothetical protein